MDYQRQDIIRNVTTRNIMYFGVNSNCYMLSSYEVITFLTIVQHQP